MIKALPVIDQGAARDRHHHDGGFHAASRISSSTTALGERLRSADPESAQTTHSDKPEAVGQIMTRQVRVASAAQRVTELVTLFSTEGHHHIPVIDGNQKLVGIITQSDLVRVALHARFAT